MFDDSRMNDAYPMLSAFSDPLSKPAREIIGREKEKLSLMSSLARPELCNAILLAPAGTGKAHPNDELIPVADERGYIRIGLLKTGDRVFGEDGEPVAASGLFPQGLKREYIVTVAGRDQVRCNDEHLWTVRDLDDPTGMWRTLTLREIMDQGLTRVDGSSRWILPDSGALVRQSRVLPLHPYVMGVFLGWGVRVEADNGWVSLPNAVPDEVFTLIEAQTGWVRERCTNGDRSVFRYLATGEYVTGEQVMRHPLVTGVLGKDEHVRKVPHLYLTSSIADRTDLLRALHESAVYREHREADDRQVWVVDSDVHELERSLAVTGDMITGVEDTGREVEMTCLMVDSDTHLYQVGRGHVVTHNTALVQACMVDDPERIYLEVDLARMIADLSNPEEMAARLKTLFDEAEQFSKTEAHELVLFIDEFHQVVQLSNAAVEALKPLLAASGVRGIKVIAATTYDEFNTHIASNLPLVERLARINIPPTNRRVTIEILKSMAKRYGVADQIWNDSLYAQIYEYTNRYVPASVQPRKSIRVLDAMVGRHRYTGERMDKKLLATVLKIEFDVEVEISVDAAEIKKQLDARVFSQDFATTSIARRLQLCVAGLNDPEKPMSSLLFTGATGTGKFCTDSTRVPVFSEDGSVAFKRHGDLIPGDRVFQRDGSIQEVLGFFPQGEQDIYRVHTWDGRHLDVGGPHLWGVYTSKMRLNKHKGKNVQPRVMTTLEMLEAGVVHVYPSDTREHVKFFIPMNEAVQWPEADLPLDPYVVGAFIGNGCLTQTPLTFSSNDIAVVRRVSDAIGFGFKKKSVHDYSWLFRTGEKIGKNDKLVQTADLFAELPELIGAYSAERRIPRQYMTASIEQRWELVRGLFDTDGSINRSTGRYNVSYSTFSQGLAEDVRELLFSLGVSNTVKVCTRTKDDNRMLVEYVVHVKVGNDDKARFFWLERKRAIAEEAKTATSDRERVKKFDMVGITKIEKLPYRESASCIYVDNDEHLYQAGDFIVTHNTEVTKQLAQILFGDDQRHLVRFDMSEWGRDESVDVFREELASRVWATSHCILLFDEIEKASPLVTRLLLQVLDDGRLSDKDGRQVSFLNTYIVMTTNAGSEIYRTIGEYSADDSGSEEVMKEYEKIIQTSIKSARGNRFPPELLGRIDAIVPFQPLARSTLRKITMKKLAAMVGEVMRKHGVRVIVDKRVVDFLVEDESQSDSDAGGARDMVRRMARYVTTEVAAFVNRYPEEREISVKIDGVMRSEDKSILKSSARVVVQPYDPPVGRSIESVRV